MTPSKSRIKVEKYSISKILRGQNRSNDLFEIMLCSLTLEEIISLKLELTTRTVGTNIYGVEIWKALKYIVRDAVMKYAISVSRSKKSAARFLNMGIKEFHLLFRKYNPFQYEENNNDLK